MKKGFPYLLIVGMGSVCTIMSLWCRDVVREATYQGAHTLRVIYNLKYAFFLFVVSEAMFFSGFF